jgi:uncharacterized membrane protein YphA (DoxX/SURF4 family)
VQRLFPSFPAGWPSVGLLLLRAAVGLTLVVQGTASVLTGQAPSMGGWAIGVLEVASGASLLVGFLTPMAGAVAGLSALGSALSWFPSPASHILDDQLSIVFIVIMAAAIVLLGPGAVSLDARLFGRREIIIPGARRTPQP